MVYHLLLPGKVKHRVRGCGPGPGGDRFGAGAYAASLLHGDPAAKDSPMSDGPAISIRNLVKRYASEKGSPGKLALDGVSFDVPQGGIFGLLGPNGAGKSTLINILAGLVTKTSGTAEIWGF